MKQAAPHKSQVQIPGRLRHCLLLMCSFVFILSCYSAAQVALKDSASIAEYRTQLQAHPDNPQYVSELAAAVHRHGEPDAAISELQKFLQAHPGSNAVRLELARYLGYAKKFPEALDQYSEVLRRDPNSFVAQVGIAKVLSWEGDLNASLRAYDKILERSPHLYDARVGKGYTLLWMGEKEQAYALLRSAANTHPEDKEVAQTAADLKTELGADDTQQHEARSEEKKSSVPASALRQHEPPGAKPKRNRYPSHDGPAAYDPPNSFPEPIAPIKTAVPQGNSQMWMVLLPATILVGSVIAFVPLLRYHLRRRRFLSAHIPPSNKTTASASAVVPPAKRITTSPDAQINFAPKADQFQPSTESLPNSGKSHQQTEPEPALHGCVLLVDSNQAVLNFESMVLSSAGAEVVIAETGYAAIQVLEEKRVDAVVIDCQAHTDISWRDLHNWIAQRRPELSGKILLTCTGGNSEIQQLKLQTGLECLAKPLGITELICAASKILSAASTPNTSNHDSQVESKISALGLVANQSR